MKILALVSSGLGHLDFGGDGYLNVVRELLNRGHKVKFLAPKNVVDKLNTYGIESIPINYINRLWLRAESNGVATVQTEIIQLIKTIELIIKSERPSLVLVDRLLGLAGNLLDHLQIPFVGMGTPGGNWLKNNESILPGISIHNFNGQKDFMNEQLKWNISSLSAWCNSTFLNVVFLGQQFYPTATNPNTAYVNLFTNHQMKYKVKVALSLGSGSYYLEEFYPKLIDLVLKIDYSDPIDVYGHKDFMTDFFHHLSATEKKRFNPMGFVPFERALSDVSHLIFAGGIGTIWRCINMNVVPLAIPGHIHDQDFNSGQLKKLGILPDWENKDTVALSINEQISQLKNDLVFNERLESVVDRILAMAN